MDTTPCPYKPFGVPCTLQYAHRSPHEIVVEAALVEQIVAKIKGQSKVVEADE